MNNVFFFLLFFPLAIAHGTEVLSDNPLSGITIEEDPLIKSLEEKQKGQKIIRAKQYVEAEKHASIQVEKSAETRQDEVQLYFGELKENALLIEAEGKKRHFLAPHKMFVRLRREKGNFETVFIIDSKGKRRFETNRNNIISIEEVSKLSPTPRHYVEYPPAKEYDGGDKKLQLKPYYNFHLETLSFDNKNGTASRNEIKTYYGWKQPYEFGISISLEQANFSASETNQSEAKWQTYYFGPSARWLFFRDSFLYISLETSVQKSLNFIYSTPSYENHYSAEIFELGSEIIMPTELGQFFIGGHYRLLRKSLEESTSPIQTPETNKMNNRILTLSFGYGKEFSW